MQKAGYFISRLIYLTSCWKPSLETDCSISVDAFDIIQYTGRSAHISNYYLYFHDPKSVASVSIRTACFGSWSDTTLADFLAQGAILSSKISVHVCYHGDSTRQ